MNDFNAVSYTKLIPVQEIGIHSGTTLYVTGKDVTSVEVVYLNGTSTKDFIVVSKTRLLVDIPSVELNKPITSVTLAGKSGDVGLLSFDAKANTRSSNNNYVVQRFFRVLMMDPGSDVFNPDEGIGLVSRMGNIDFEDVEVFISGGIKEAEAYVKTTQRPELPDSKTLRMVNIINVSYSIGTLTASVSLQFVLADGSIVDTDFNLAG